MALVQLTFIDTPTSEAIEKKQDWMEDNISDFVGFLTRLKVIMESAVLKAKLAPTEGPLTTPNQPIPPVNSDRVDSMTGSESTSQNKVEEPSKDLANELIEKVLSVMQDDFRLLSWCKSPFSVRISKE